MRRAAAARVALCCKARLTVYDEIAANRRRSAVLIISFVVIVAAVGWAFNLVIGGGPVGLIIALVFTLVSTLTAYWTSDKVALAMSHAQPADPEQYARLHNIVEGLCIASGLQKPRLFVIEDQAPNAFATGRDPKHAAIAVTTGLMEKLTRIELEGVLAHELSHVKNRDILVSTLAVTMVGVIALMSDWALRFLWWGGPRHRDDRRDSKNNAFAAMAIIGFVLLVAAPFIARLMQFAVSRRRETLADVSGVAMTRYPPGLISALEKLQADRTVVHSASRATAHLWIESPIARNQTEAIERGESRMVRINRLFDTHPPLEERIAALREL